MTLEIKIDKEDVDQIVSAETEMRYNLRRGTLQEYQSSVTKYFDIFRALVDKYNVPFNGRGAMVDCVWGMVVSMDGNTPIVGDTPSPDEQPDIS